jgi:adenylylsulfate kinase
MSGVVVWITGLPSAGKSKLATRVAESLRSAGGCPCVLDGDAVRGLIQPAPGYGPQERADFYETLARLAGHLAHQGHTVLVPATANQRAYRDRARELAPHFIEVFVDVPLSTCRERDAKGLYAAAQAGHVDNMPGAGPSYERPETPDIIARGGLDDAARDVLVKRLLA